MKIVLDFPTWTYGQIERLEQAAGKSIAAVGRELAAYLRDEGDLSTTTLVALGYAQEARTNPEVTLEEFRGRPFEPIELELPPGPLGSPETGE